MKYTSFTLLFWLFIQFSYGQLVHLHCGKLVDVEEQQVIEKATIILDGSKIQKVERGYSEPAAGVEVIDLKEYTVMPGLMDMHVHLEGEMNENSYNEGFRMNAADFALRSVGFAEVTLMSGFTTVRDLGGSGVNISLRDAVDKGWIKGPRIFTAGKTISITGGHGDPTNGLNYELMKDPGARDGVVNGVADCRKAVRQRYKHGADLIKIMATGGVLSEAKDGTGPHFTEEEMTAICETARDLGLRVAAHAHGAEGMKRAIRAGVTSIEHGTLMDEEVMDLMLRRGTWYVPTITAGKAVTDSAKLPGYFPEVVTPKALAIGPKIQGTFGKAYKKGVKIAFGTDAGVFKHGVNGLEFIYMHEAGMPVIEIIVSATLSAAELLDVDDRLGSIEAGKIADIVAVKGDPIQDVTIMKSMDFVMKEGVIYKHE